MPTPEEWGEVVGLLAPGWAADGPRVRDFQQEAARWFGAERGVAVNSGSSALQLALRAAGAGPGSRVAVPAYCCAALLNAVSAAGAEPLIVDSVPGGYHLSPDDLANRWESGIAAIVAVHMFGDPVDVEPFRRFGVPIIEDCAQSIGARVHGRYTGAVGDLSIGSFYATKVLTTGHGGIVTSTNSALVEAVSDLTEYDNRDDWQPRFSVGMSELQAALGLWQLARLGDFLRRRRAIADYYTGQAVAELGLAPANQCTAGAEPIFYRFVLRARDAEEAFQRLRLAGVDAKRPVYRPLHHYLGGEFPHAQAAHAQIVSLPIYPTLADADVEHVAAAVKALADLWV
jgi:dTDP-4-amino-4,6-dideoxygalactose transaminase